MNRNMKYTLGGFMLVALALAIACVKPANEEEFGPLASKSCTDGILNQGEYFADCGGPCAACGINSYVNFVVAAKTWSHPDSTDIPVKSSKDSVVYLDTARMRIVMIEASTNTILNFVINKNWRGVQELGPGEISGSLTHPSVGNVGLESGVITITNVDEVNNYISGEFKFNCAPNTNGVRVSVLQGIFRDQATAPPI